MPEKTLNHARIYEVQNGAPLVACLAEKILEIRHNDSFSRVVVVVPSHYSAFFLRRALTDEMCVKRRAGLFNVEFMRVEEVADRLFDSVQRDIEKPAMSRLIASELVHNAMLHMTAQGPLTDHRNNDSTLDAVQRTLQELERLDIGAEEALDQIAGGASAGLHRQLIDIQRDYSIAASDYLTRENKAAIAADVAENNPSVVATVLGQHIITIRAPIPPDAYSRLRDVLGGMTSATTLQIESGQAIRLITTGTSETDFFSTTGAADEPRALIRNIISDAREGIKFGEMAVLYPSIDYASRIKDALNDAGIVNCGPSTRTLADTSAGKFVALFLNMIAGEMRRNAFTAWTTSAPVVDHSDGIRVPAVPWEIVSRNAKVSRFGGDDRWQRSLRRFAHTARRRAKRAEETPDEDNAVDPESWRTMAGAADRLVEFVSNLNRKTHVENDRTWDDWVDWLDEILEDYLTPNRRRDEQETSGLRRIREELSHVRELNRIGSAIVSFARFSRTIQRVLRVSLTGDAGWGSAVLVAPIEAGTSNSFKSVHILGMSEGNLPRPGRSDPLLSDDLRRGLDPEGSRLTTKNHQLESEREMFYLALQSAPRRRLYWNKALLGATNESYPSPWFVDTVMKTFDTTSVTVKSLMDNRSEHVETVTALSDFKNVDLNPSSVHEFRLKDVAVCSRSTGSLRELLAEPANQNLARGREVAVARRSPLFGPHDGNVDAARDIAVPNLQLSASTLQNYAECPYKYFLASHLNVDERVDPEDSLVLSALDRGILVHLILERFLAEIGPDDTSEGREHLRRIAQEEFDRFHDEEFIGYPAIFRLETGRLMRQLEQWQRVNLDVLHDYDGEMMTEVGFGFEDSLGTVTLAGGLELQFRGKIDLIALSASGDRALVVDFKTGSSTKYTVIDKDITAKGTKLQLPLYARVANELLDGSADIEAAYWFVFQDSGVRLRPKDKAALEETYEGFDQVMEIAIDGIQGGKFPARPGDRNTYGGGPPWTNCKICAYSEVCTSDRLVAWDRKKSTPELAQYVTLAEGEGS
ncbi:MAG: hypothetical protein F4Y63_01245 [Chloroflexi bacterium]|nr:hypothetical protein [Chloroflexota bacterium]